MSIQSSFNALAGAAFSSKAVKKFKEVGNVFSKEKGASASQRAKTQARTKKQHKTEFQKRLANIKIKKQVKATRETLKAGGYR